MVKRKIATSKNINSMETIVEKFAVAQFVNAFIKLEIQCRVDKSQPHHRPAESLSHKYSF